MLSLDNTYSEEEIRDFVKRLEKLLPGEKLDWIVEPKVDGVAISLRYENGVLVHRRDARQRHRRRRRHGEPENHPQRA